MSCRTTPRGVTTPRIEAGEHQPSCSSTSAGASRSVRHRTDGPGDRPVSVTGGRFVRSADATSSARDAWIVHTATRTCRASAGREGERSRPGAGLRRVEPAAGG